MRRLLTVTLLLLLSLRANADCAKLTEQYDFNAKLLAEYLAERNAAAKYVPTRMDIDRQLLFQAMIAERCLPLPPVNAEAGYIIDATKCATERIRSQRFVGDGACDLKAWKSILKQDAAPTSDASKKQ